MLDKMVESTNSKGSKTVLRSLLMAVGSVTTALFTGALIFSIFATNLAMSGEDLVTTSLQSPITLSEPDPEPELTKEPTQSTSVSKEVLPTRVVNMKRVTESPTVIPKNVKVTKNSHRARPVSNFRISKIDSEGVSSSSNARKDSGAKGGGLVSDSKGTQKTEPKVVKDTKVKKVTPVPPKLKKSPPKIVRISRIDPGKALRKVTPIRSQAAKAVQARGTVKVNVLISESGKVISAKVVSGHALLRNSARVAALKSLFRPTILNGNPVKVSGLIVYNFN